MITKRIDENSISVVPNNPDDLLNLRRIIKIGDKITGDTTRVLKQDKEYSRPDRERIKVRIVLDVQNISLDNVLDRLRIRGTILESSNESVAHGSHHSFVLKVGQKIVVSKKWSALDKSLLKSSNTEDFALVAIDRGDCGIARLSGTHLEFLPNIYSGSAGKRYKTSYDAEKYFAKILQAVETIDGKLIIFGPGETKKRFANFVKVRTALIAEGIDSGGEDGIYSFTKSQAMKEIMATSKLARVSHIIDDVMMLANKQSSKFTMGFKETYDANKLGAVESLVFSDSAISENDEQDVINLLNDAQGKGVEIYAVDTTTDIGLRVSGLGGIISVLRYSIS